MSNIEKIVADYETCRKVWEIGLRVESLFKYEDADSLVICNKDYGCILG